MLNGPEQPLFTLVQKFHDAAYVSYVQIRLSGNVGKGVLALTQCIDFSHQFDGTMLPPGKILDKAHQVQLFAVVRTTIAGISVWPKA